MEMGTFLVSQQTGTDLELVSVPARPCDSCQSPLLRFLRSVPDC
jgi:hypothetical protein